MNYLGIIIGIVTFIIIGIFHPIVIKAEYFFGKKVWPIFLFVGVGAIVLSLFISNVLCSTLAGVFGFSSLWSIHELFEQEERVKKGWFPKNTNKK